LTSRLETALEPGVYWLQVSAWHDFIFDVEDVARILHLSVTQE
jgi:hypothetical protein